MSGSSFGTLFRITTWGESHGAAIGVVIDGCPAGLSLSESDIQAFLDRRRPGQSRYTTKRSETDQVEILSGIFEGKTTGTPISLLVRNQDQRSRDYGEIASCYRPGHADYTFQNKYGFRDYRGGGRTSGRETIGRVAAGAVASALLKTLGIKLTAFSKSIGPVTVPESEYRLDEVTENPLYMPNMGCQKAADYLNEMMEQKDSCGGIIECRVTGLPVGLGEPVFDKLDAQLSKGIMSIGAVKAVEIGDGFLAAASNGSTNNDAFAVQDGQMIKRTNHSGGVTGRYQRRLRADRTRCHQADASIARPQSTVNIDKEEIEISIKGRHDPIIVPRAVVVVESMTARYTRRSSSVQYVQPSGFHQKLFQEEKDV